MGLLQKLFPSLRQPRQGMAAPAELRLSPGGIGYVLQPDDADNRVAIGMAFRGGFMDDRADAPPAALVVMPALFHQSFGGEAAARQDRLADLGASVALLPQALETQGIVTAPRRSIDEAVRLCTCVFRPERIGEDAMRTGIEAARSNLRQARADPQARNVAAMLEAAVEPGPEFDPNAVTEADLARVTPQELTAWCDRHLARARLRACVVGPIDGPEADEAVDTLFAPVPEGRNADVRPPDLRPRTGPERITLEAGGAGPATLLLAASAHRASSPDDYLAAHMFAFILAGDEGARLFRAIRDRSEASYGLRCAADVDAHSISMSVAGTVARAGIEDTIERIRAIVAELAETGPTEAETARAKAALRQYHREIRLRHDAAATEMIALLGAGWDVDAVNGVADRIEALDLRGATPLLQPLAARPIIVASL